MNGIWNKSNGDKQRQQEVNLSPQISDHTQSNNSLNRRGKFWRQVMNKLLDCLTIQLMKMIKSYKHTGKGFILLCDLAENIGQKIII